MTGVLYFDSVNRKYSKSDWVGITADGAPPGVYTPNMSQEEAERWRAKHIGGKRERVEVRKQVWGVNLVMNVYKDGALSISANGRIKMNPTEANEFMSAIREAMDILEVGE